MVERQGSTLGADGSPTVSKACTASLEGVSRQCHQESPLMYQEVPSCLLMHGLFITYRLTYLFSYLLINQPYPCTCSLILHCCG